MLSLCSSKTLPFMKLLSSTRAAFKDVRIWKALCQRLPADVRNKGASSPPCRVVPNENVFGPWKTTWPTVVPKSWLQQWLNWLYHLSNHITIMTICISLKMDQSSHATHFNSWFSHCPFQQLRLLKIQASASCGRRPKVHRPCHLDTSGVWRWSKPLWVDWMLLDIITLGKTKTCVLVGCWYSLCYLEF